MEWNSHKHDSRHVHLENELRRAETETVGVEARAVVDCYGGVLVQDKGSCDSSSASRSPSRKRPRVSHFGRDANLAKSSALDAATAVVSAAAKSVISNLMAARIPLESKVSQGPALPDSEMFVPALGRFPGDPPSGKALKKKMCQYWEAGACARGTDCAFAHGTEELAVECKGFADRNGVPATTRMDFTSTRANHVSRVMSIPQMQVNAIMTDVTKKLLIELSGVEDVQWKISAQRVTLVGTAVQVEKAVGMLTRVSTHGMWGISEPKVHGLLRPRTDCTSVKCRLAPMVPYLKGFTANLTLSKPLFSLGTGSSNELIVKGEMLSRNHMSFEFVPSRGTIYVIDTSTNGTWVNGVRLPAKGSAKVVLWHGDEILLHDPEQGGAEYGYMVNLEFL